MPVKTQHVPIAALSALGLNTKSTIHYQLQPDELSEHTLLRGQGEVNETGALCIRTGEFTGRSPQDKFIVKDALTEDSVHWNNFNIAIAPEKFTALKAKVLNYLNAQEELWVRDAYACADPQYRLNIRVINEHAWSNLFAYNMFLCPTEQELSNFEPDWHIIQAPG
ncbi:MAG: phosphoenolpyruvate carboxykinase, partial [Bacteroidota bacterium]